MDITEYDEFYKWYKANERRFHCSQMTEVQIAYSAYLHGIEQSHKPVVMQGLLSNCCQAPVTTTEIHYCDECECSCSPTVASGAVRSQTSAQGFWCVEPSEPKCKLQCGYCQENQPTKQLQQHSVMQGLPEYNEIFYHARILDIDQFRDYWNSLGSPTEKNK